MMSNIHTKYEHDLALVGSIYAYNQNKEAFGANVENFDDPNALRAYIVLVSYYQQLHEIPPDLLKLIAPEKFFQKLNEPGKLWSKEKEWCNYLVDAFEVMATATKCTDDSGFYNMCHSNLQTALRNEQSDIISVYLQILHRLDRVFTTEIPIELLKTIIESIHGSISDVRIQNEALILIEANIKKRHRLENNTMANEQLLNFMWQNLCSSRVAKHQCNICYTIVSQLIEVYLHECKVNESFEMQFLSAELWHFIRAAIESKEMVRRKQAIFMLQNILDTNEEEVMRADEYNGTWNDDLPSIWKNYFAVLESLLEIQCHLIISCLDQYLEGIVEHLPPFWYSIVFALVLRHHNNVIIHYGIEFILRHGISLQHNSHLMNGFYQALNNTYLHAEAKVSDRDLAKYFQESDMNHTLNIMLMISWQPIPLWTVVKSLVLYIQSTKGAGFQITLLLDFLKRSVRVIKNMPEVDDMTVSILQNITTTELTLEQILGLYDVIPREEILNAFKLPLDLRTFELSFIQLNQITIETKISYFQYAIPNVSDRSKFLDAFYEEKQTMIHYFPHFEFLLFDSLCQEKSINAALFVIKPRIYNLMKPQGNFTLDGVAFATTLLKFIVTKFTSDDSDVTTFDSINKVLDNIYEILRKKMCVDHSNMMKIHQIKSQLTLISMRLTKRSEIYPNKMAVLGVLSDAMIIEDETIDLVSGFRTTQV